MVETNHQASVILPPDRIHDFNPDILEGVYRSGRRLDRYEVLVAVRDGSDWVGGVRELTEDAPANVETRRLPVSSDRRAVQVNRAVEQARSDVLVLLGSDMQPVGEWLPRHVDLHRRRPEETVVGIGPATFPEEIATPFMRWLDGSGAGLGYAPADGGPGSSFFYALNTSMKRSFFRHAGGMDERFPYHAADDDELGKRLRAAGMESVYLPDAEVQHWHEVDIEERSMQMRWSGESARIWEGFDPEFEVSDPGHPLWAYTVGSLVNRGLARLTGSSESRHRAYRYLHRRAFLEGYRDAQTFDPGADAPAGSIDREPR